MGQKRQDETPIAVARADAFAREARKYGLRARVEVETHPAEYYKHEPTEIMLAERITAWAIVDDEWLGVFGDHLMVGWSSVRPGQAGYSATTRFMSGNVSRTLLPTKKLSERASWSELANYRYRLDDPAKYGIKEDTTPESAWSWSK